MHIQTPPPIIRSASPRHYVAAVTVVLLALIGWTAPASAQLSRVGTNPLLVSAGMRGSDVAYDPANNVYLVVGAYGSVWGAFVNSNGDAVTSGFTISDGAGFAHFPRVVYSPHASNGAGGTGGFLVTWHESTGPAGNFVNTRVVAYPNRLVTAQRVISSTPTWWESGAAIAYSTVSQLFLVTWRSGDYLIWGARIGPDGQTIGSAFQISESGLGARDPNVAWNPNTNEFGVVYTGWGPSGATTTFARVNASGGVVRRNIFNFAGATYITDLAFNTATGRFVALWSENGTRGAEIDASGDVLALGLISTTTGTYDGLGVAYNPQSGTFLLVGQGPSADVWAAELNSRGARTSSDTIVTSAGGPIGSFYPRVTAKSNAREWNLSFAHNFSALRDQVVSTSSTGGGPAGSLGAAPSTGGSTGGSTSSCPGTAPFPGAICVNGGWVPGDSGTTSSGGSTGGCPGTAPFPGAICVNGGWVPGDSGTTSSGGSTSGCPGTAPFPGAICVNGGWVPGDSGTTSSGGSTGGCPGTAPFPGAICVNGGWVPGDSGTTSSGGSTSGCPGTAPFPGAICVNGGWIPGSSGSTSGSSSGGCTTPDPFVAIGGGTCVNGGWIPGGSGSAGSSSGCPGTAPFPGAICVNGGWVPGTSGSSSGGCTTPAPGSGWVCVNGGWLPPDNPAATTCTGSPPGSGWVCVNGGWLPPDNPAALSLTSTSSSSGGCTTPDPFVAIGGGICINGGWIPKN